MGPFQEMSIVAFRISRLDADGTPSYEDPDSAIAVCSGLSTFEYDHEIQEGEDIVELDGAGNPCVIRKKDDVVKRTTFTLTLCTQDHRIDDVLGVADPVLNAGNVVGKIVNVGAGCGEAAQRPAVALELWSERWLCNTADITDPYLRSVLPLAKLVPKGRTKQNGVSKPVYTGFSVPNPNFGDGPWGDLDDVSAENDWSYGEFDDTDLPSCPTPFDYQIIPSSAS